jgi:hypothetical protein
VRCPSVDMACALPLCEQALNDVRSVLQNTQSDTRARVVKNTQSDTRAGRQKHPI